MSNHPDMLTALKDLLYKMNTDPVFMDQIRADFAAAAIQRENELICAVIDENYRNATIGDMIMYGIDHDYYDKLEMEALDLFYQFHGQGD